MIFKRHNTNIYDKVFKLFRENARLAPHDRVKNNSDYSHIFLAVNNYNSAQLPYYSASIMNNNFPELVERLIWEHLFDISDSAPTEDEIRAHYNWMLKRLSDLCEERIAQRRQNNKDCKDEEA